MTRASNKPTFFHYLLFVLAGVLFVGSWYALFAPVHVTVAHPAGSSLTLTAKGSLLHITTIQSGDKLAVTARVTVDGDGIVELALPISADGRRMRFDELPSAGGRWNQTYGGERIESSTPGSFVVLPLVGDALQIAFLHRADGGSARIDSSAGSRRVELRHHDYGWQPEPVLTGEVHTLATVSLWRAIGGFEVEYTGTGHAAIGTMAFGNKSIFHRFELASGQTLALKVAPRTIVSLLVAGLSDLGFIALLALAGLVATTLAGLGLMFLLRLPHASAPRYMLALTMGCTLLPLLANSLSYLIPAIRLGGWLALPLALLLGAGVVAIVQQRRLSGGIRPRPAALPIAVILATIAGVWLAYWPLAVVGSQAYLGLLQTDSFFYTTVSNVIAHNGLLDLIAHGSLVGHGMRSIDVATIAALSSMTGLDANTTWAATTMALMLIPPLATFHLVHEWRHDARIATISAVTVALSAPITGLFFESYFTQFVLTPLLYLNLYVGNRYLQACRQRDVRAVHWLPLATTSAAVMLLYPYFALPTAIIIGYGLWLLRRTPALLLRTNGALLGAFIASANIGLLFFAGSTVAKGFTSHLNDIARYIVFPFYGEAKFANFIFGLVPFHGDIDTFRQMAEASDSLYPHLLSEVYGTLSPIFLLVIAVVLCLAFVANAVARRKALLDPFGCALALTLLAYGALLVAIYQVSGLYAYAKLAWTLATLLPLFLVPVLLQPGVVTDTSHAFAGSSGGRRIVRTVVGMIVVVYVAMNAFSRFSAPAMWLDHPENAAAKTNVGIAYDLQLLRDWLKSDDRENRRFRFTGDNGSQSQRLQVLAGHSFALLTSHGVECTNCRSLSNGLDYRTFTHTVANEDYVINIGPLVQRCLPGYRLHGAAPDLAIFERKAPNEVAPECVRAAH